MMWTKFCLFCLFLSWSHLATSQNGIISLSIVEDTILIDIDQDSSFYLPVYLENSSNQSIFLPYFRKTMNDLFLIKNTSSLCTPPGGVVYFDINTEEIYNPFISGWLLLENNDEIGMKDSAFESLWNNSILLTPFSRQIFYLSFEVLSYVKPKDYNHEVYKNKFIYYLEYDICKECAKPYMKELEKVLNFKYLDECLISNDFYIKVKG